MFLSHVLPFLWEVCSQSHGLFLAHETECSLGNAQGTILSPIHFTDRVINDH